MYLNELMKPLESDAESRIKSNVQYDIYSNDNIFFRPMTDEAWAGPTFVDKYRVTETRQFEAS